MQCSLLCQSFKFINTGHEIENSKLNLKKTFFFFAQVEHQADSRPAVVEEQGGIVGALAKALQSRSAQIQGSGKAIPKKMSVWITAWEFLDPGGRGGFLFYIFFKVKLIKYW